MPPFTGYMLLNWVISTLLLLGSTPSSTGVIEDRVSMGKIPQSYGNGIAETGALHPAMTDLMSLLMMSCLQTC